MKDIIKRFWDKVGIGEKGECWIWHGSCDERGYGRFSVKGKNTKATHFSLTQDDRPRPSKNHVSRHSCDNPSCVNPNHLQWGTQLENIQDTKYRGRARNNPSKGVSHVNSKLTDDMVRNIIASNEVQWIVAERFGVSQQLVSQIKRGIGWRHIR